MWKTLLKDKYLLLNVQNCSFSCLWTIKIIYEVLRVPMDLMLYGKCLNWSKSCFNKILTIKTQD